MRATGIIRRIDDLGRVVVPKEIRKYVGIKEGDPLEIFVDEDKIILKKYESFVGLKELIRRLEEEFLEVKNDMDLEITEKINEHINALHEIINGN